MKQLFIKRLIGYFIRLGVPELRGVVYVHQIVNSSCDNWMIIK